MTQNIAEKSKLSTLIRMSNFYSRKGIYQTKIFVYKTVKISKVEAITHATFHDFKFPDKRQQVLLTFKIALTAGKLRPLFVLRAKRICHPRRYDRVEALTSLQRSSLTSVFSTRYRSPPPHTSASAQVILVTPPQPF
jgi:hypothetical protein